MIESLAATPFFSQTQAREAMLGATGGNPGLDSWDSKRRRWESELPRGFTADLSAEPIYSLDFINFPKNIQEFRARQREVPVYGRIISALDLGVDFSKAFWAELDLNTKFRDPRFLAREEHFKGPVTIVFGQGLATFYGHEYFRRAAPWARNMMTHGTYNHPTQYFEGMGADVVVAKTDALINRGDIKKNKMTIKTSAERVKMTSNAPVYLLMHSVDALSAQVFMSENRKLASELDGIILVGGPLPVSVNPWVGDVFLMSGDKSDNFEYVEPVIDLYQSGAARTMNIVSIKDSPDRVLDGFPGGVVIPVREDGHSSILHQHRNLRGIVHYINENSYPEAQLAA